MDELDFRILARLVREPLASLSEVGRGVELSPNAVRSRIASLRAKGVYGGTVGLPNARLFDRVGKLAIYAPPARPIPPGDVLRIDDVLGYSVNHDGQVAVTWLARSPGEAPPASLDRLMGAMPPRVLVRDEPPLTPKGTVLSRDQWRLVEELMQDARRTHRDLARATGLSERVVARHVAWLVDGRHLVLTTTVLPDLADGVVPYHLWVHGTGVEDERGLRGAIGWCEVEERLREPKGLFVFCQAETLGGALAARDRVAKLPGIDHAEIVLQGEWGVAWDRLRAMCRERAAASP